MKDKGILIPSTEQFKKALKDKNLKATPQRLAVHGAMQKLGHASADMVVEEISRSSGQSVTTSSVYNTLSQLADLHIYERRFSSNNKMYFDVINFRHLHLFDTKNKEFHDIIDDELIQLVDKHFKGRRFRGFKLDSIDIQLICHSTRRTPREIAQSAQKSAK